MVREKPFFFKVREKSGNFASSQGNSKFLFKVSETGNFIFRLPLFYGQKAMSFQEISINQCEEKRIDDLQMKLKQMSTQVNTLYSLSHIMHGQWKLFCGPWKVREKSRNFFYTDGWQPCCCCCRRPCCYEQLLLAPQLLLLLLFALLFVLFFFIAGASFSRHCFISIFVSRLTYVSFIKPHFGIYHRVEHCLCKVSFVINEKCSNKVNDQWYF